MSKDKLIPRANPRAKSKEKNGNKISRNKDTSSTIKKF
jgi:hypothetical protein